MEKPTVAILGASADRNKYGNKAIRAYRSQGYDVFPINPKGGEIEGLVAYRNLAEVPVSRLSRISVYLKPDVVMTLLNDVVAKGCDEFWLNPGSDSDEVVAQATALGLNPIVACSIVDLGVSPDQFNE